MCRVAFGLPLALAGFVVVGCNGAVMAPEGSSAEAGAGSTPPPSSAPSSSPSPSATPTSSGSPCRINKGCYPGCDSPSPTSIRGCPSTRADVTDVVPSLTVDRARQLLDGRFRSCGAKPGARGEAGIAFSAGATKWTDLESKAGRLQDVAEASRNGTVEWQDCDAAAGTCRLVLHRMDGGADIPMTVRLWEQPSALRQIGEGIDYVVYDGSGC